MAVSSDLGIKAATGSFLLPLRRPLVHSTVAFGGFLAGGTNIPEISPKWPRMGLESRNWRNHSHRCFGIMRDKLSSQTINQETEFILNAVNMTFFERLSLAWKILFPTVARKGSNAMIAKQRLKMILFSDRCAVSDEARRKIVSNIVGALSDFVEIDSQDKVQLSVSTDPDLGTVYSVTVPVRRVKPEYQDYEENFRGITNVEYKDTGERSGSVDVRFDFFIPTNEKSQ